jgi:hypothetical protein
MYIFPFFKFLLNFGDLSTQGIQKPLLSLIFDNTGHLIFGVIFAYIFGWLGFHFSWILMLLYIVYVLDKRRLKRSWKRTYYEIQRKKSEKKKEVSKTARSIIVSGRGERKRKGTLVELIPPKNLA